MSLLCVAMVTTVAIATSISMVTIIWDVVGIPGMLEGDGSLNEQVSLWARTARMDTLKQRRRKRRSHMKPFLHTTYWSLGWVGDHWAVTEQCVQLSLCPTAGSDPTHHLVQLLEILKREITSS